MLVGHGGDLAGVAQQPGDEGAPGRGELVLAGRVVEGVALALENGAAASARMSSASQT